MRTCSGMTRGIAAVSFLLVACGGRALSQSGKPGQADVAGSSGADSGAGSGGADSGAGSGGADSDAGSGADAGMSPDAGGGRLGARP